MSYCSDCAARDTHIATLEAQNKALVDAICDQQDRLRQRTERIVMLEAKAKCWRKWLANSLGFPAQGEGVSDKSILPAAMGYPAERAALLAELATLREDKARLDYWEMQETCTINETRHDSGQEAWVVLDEGRGSLRDHLDAARKEAPGDQAQGD